MAEPTLKDVLKALARLEKGQAEIRAEMATKEDAAELRADVAAHRAETKKGFADLDKELATHSEKVHRRIEEDLQYLKGRPARSAARAPRRRPAK